MFPIFQKVFLAPKKLSKKKGLVLAILILCGTLILVPVASVQAGVLSSILNTISTGLLGPGVMLSLSAILHLFLGLSYALMCLLSEVLEWALGNPFTYSLTNPGGNTVINIGWTVLRDLSNMLFVMGLAYIGLATALNLGGFNTKKTFGRLIVAALLINFTPVICGVIVDATNILMKFFTAEVGNNFNAFSIMYADKGGWKEVVQEAARDSFTTAGLIKIFCSFFYTSLVSGIFFIFIFLLLARNIAIWLLVIFSPLAFFCWIFDATKKHFNRWWKEFLNWSFIGVFTGFVLYLSAVFLNAFKKGDLTNTTVFSADFNVFTQLMPYLIICLFMGFAYIQVLKSSAMGSQGAIQAAQFVGGKIKSGSKKLGQYGLTKARNAALKAEEKRGFGAGSRIGKGPRWFTGRGTPEEEKDWGSNGVGGTGLAGMAVRHGLAKASEAQTREAEEAAKKAGDSMESNEAALKNALALKQLQKATAILNKMMKNGNYKFSDYAKGQLPKIMEHAVKSNPLEVLSNMRFMDPILSEKLAEQLKGKVSIANLQKSGLFMSDDDIRNERYMATDEKGEAYVSLAKKLFSIAKPAVIESWSKETAQTYIKDFVNDIGTGTHVQKIGEVFGRELVDQFIDGIESPEYYIKRGNLALGRWIMSGSAANMGISYDDNEEAKKIFTAYSRSSAYREKELSELTEEAQGKQADLTQKNQEVQDLQTKKITVEQEINALNQEIAALDAAKEPSVIQWEKRDKLQAENTNIDRQIQELNSQIGTVQKQFTETSSKIQEAQAEHAKIEQIQETLKVKTVPESEVQAGMLKYRTEQQLKKEEYKAKESAVVESQKIEALKGIKSEERKTREEIKRLGEKIEKAGEKKAGAEKQAQFYGPIAGQARQERQAKTDEAKELGLRSFWNKPKYPETTIKKEGKQEKKLTAQAGKEGRPEIRQIRKEARQQQKEIKKQDDSQEQQGNSDTNA